MPMIFLNVSIFFFPENGRPSPRWPYSTSTALDPVSVATEARLMTSLAEHQVISLSSFMVTQSKAEAGPQYKE